MIIRLLAEGISFITEHLGTFGMFAGNYGVQYILLFLVTISYLKNHGHYKKKAEKGFTYYRRYKDISYSSRPVINNFLAQNGVNEMDFNHDVIINNAVRRTPLVTLIQCVENELWIDSPSFFYFTAVVMTFAYTLLKISIVYKFFAVFAATTSSIFTIVSQYWWLIAIVFFFRKIRRR